MIVVPNSKKMEIIMSIQVCFIPQMNINFKESCGKKSISCKSKTSIRVSQCGEQDCSANNKKNEDYNQYPSFSHFMVEH